MTPLKPNTIISVILLFFVLLTLPVDVAAQRRRDRELGGRENFNPPVDSLLTDSLKQNQQSAETTAPKPSALDAPVIYSANDSIVFEEGGFAHLYGDGKVNYENIELSAQIITMNMDSSTVYARGVTDTLGVETGKPVFKDGDDSYDTKAIRYKFKSKRGIINNVVTQQGEGNGIVNNTNKVANDEVGMQDVKYTI